MQKLSLFSTYSTLFWILFYQLFTSHAQLVHKPTKEVPEARQPAPFVESALDGSGTDDEFEDLDDCLDGCDLAVFDDGYHPKSSGSNVRSPYIVAPSEGSGSGADEVLEENMNNRSLHFGEVSFQYIYDGGSGDVLSEDEFDIEHIELAPVLRSFFGTSPVETNEGSGNTVSASGVEEFVNNEGIKALSETNMLESSGEFGDSSVYLLIPLESKTLEESNSDFSDDSASHEDGKSNNIITELFKKNVSPETTLQTKALEESSSDFSDDSANEDGKTTLQSKALEESSSDFSDDSANEDGKSSNIIPELFKKTVPPETTLQSKALEESSSDFSDDSANEGGKSSNIIPELFKKNVPPETTLAPKTAESTMNAEIVDSNEILLRNVIIPTSENKDQRIQERQLGPIIPTKEPKKHPHPCWPVNPCVIKNSCRVKGGTDLEEAICVDVTKDLCKCEEDGTCNLFDGMCNCINGYTGRFCEIPPTRQRRSLSTSMTSEKIAALNWLTLGDVVVIVALASTIFIASVVAMVASKRKFHRTFHV